MQQLKSMLAIEIAFIAFMVLEGAGYIVDLVHLGGQEQQKVWSEAKQIFEYTKGDNSLLMLLFGVATCFLVVAFIIFWRGSVKSAYKMQCLAEAGKKIPTFKEDIKSLFDKDLHRTLLTLPILGILICQSYPIKNCCMSIYFTIICKCHTDHEYKRKNCEN